MTAENSPHGWLRVSVGILAFLAFLWACYAAQDIIILVVVAILIAYALSPVVDVLEKLRLPFTRFRLSRGVASGVVVIGVLVLFGVVLSKVVPAIATQANNVMRDTPFYVARLQELMVQARARVGENALLSSWLSSFEQELGRISLESGRYVGKGLFTAVNAVVKLVGLVLLPIATFYVLKDGKKFRDGFLRIVPSARKEGAERILCDVDTALSSYVRGLASVCLIMATSVTIALAVIGVNNPLVLGLFAGACEVIPFVGFIMASIAIVLVGFFESPWMALKGFLAYLAVNQVLSYVITPRVMGARMKLHPLTAMVSVMIGARLAGVTGVVFALPAVAVGKVLLLHLIVGGKVTDEITTVNR
ncbi:MAG: AI-2E family transporter [Candidatus Eisenbacteria bacterium]|nr:AI-2E family transporter [Candidatus Eisenbacteria bacterium]